jgi:hypothetical protein
MFHLSNASKFWSLSCPNAYLASYNTLRLLITSHWFNGFTQLKVTFSLNLNYVWYLDVSADESISY